MSGIRTWRSRPVRSDPGSTADVLLSIHTEQDARIRAGSVAAPTLGPTARANRHAHGARCDSVKSRAVPMTALIPRILFSPAGNPSISGDRRGQATGAGLRLRLRPRAGGCRSRWRPRAVPVLPRVPRRRRPMMSRSPHQSAGRAGPASADPVRQRSHRPPSRPGPRRPGEARGGDPGRSSRLEQRPIRGSAGRSRSSSRTGGRPSSATPPAGGSSSADSATTA